MPLQIRRGTDAERQLLAVPLADGELLWTTDLKQLFVGDGVTLAQNASPVVGYNDENAQDAASLLFTHANHTGITFTYNDDTGQLVGVVDIANESINDLSDVDTTGVANGDLLIFNSATANFETGSAISATLTGNVTGNVTGDLTGSVFADDSTRLWDSTNASINLDGTVKGNVIPDTTEAYDLGSNSFRFRDLYLSGTSLFIGDAQVTASGTSINLPAGSTINGEPLGEIAQPGNNLQVNIIGEDSSIIVDSATSTIRGNFVGSVFSDGSNTVIDGATGEIFGTVRGELVGNVTGNIIGSVFSDDSTTVIDGATGELFGNINTDNITSTDPLGLTINTSKGSYLTTTNELAARITSVNNGGIFPKTQLHVVGGTLDNPTEISPGSFGASLSFSTFFDVGGNDAGKSLAVIVSQMDATATASDDAPASNLAIQVGAGDGNGDVDNDYHQFAMFNTGAFETKIVKYAEQDAAKISSITPLAGMVIFNSDTQKYQGYVDDTGLAGGGPSNSTPGWIDLH